MQNKKKIINTSFYHRLLEYVVPHRKILTLALISMAIMALTVSALPALVLYMSEKILHNAGPVLTRDFLWVVLALLIARGAASFISTYAMNATSNKVCLDLRAAMFNKLLTLPTNHYTEMTDNDLEQRFITDVNSGSQAIINASTILVKDTLIITFLLVWMFYLSREFTLFLLTILSVLLLVSQLINGYLDKTNDQMINASNDVREALFQSISKYQTIRVHGGQSQEGKRFRNKTKQMHAFNLRLINIKTLRIILGQIVAVIILTTIGYFLFQQTHNDRITTGEIASLLTAAVMLSLSLNQLLSANSFLLHGRQSLERIFSFLDSESAKHTGGVSIERPSGKLTFDKVSYLSETTDQPVLDNFSVTIKPKQTVALICASEEEKRALIDLMLGITQPTSGRILFDNQDLAELNLNSLYADIALISHKALLFDDTAATNIAYGVMECTNEAKITSAAFMSNASEFIRGMTKGLQTELGSNDVKLTPTQCQHIAIARALLRNPSILIIDEAFTSPIVSNTETKRLQDALKTLMQGRTTLFISQQPPSLVKIDHVVNIMDKKQTSNQLTKLIQSLLLRTQ